MPGTGALQEVSVLALNGRARIPPGHLRRVAIRRGLTLPALAQVADVGFNTVCQANRGRPLRVSTLNRLVAALEGRRVSSAITELLDESAEAEVETAR